jgi:hypothetical protein
VIPEPPEGGGQVLPIGQDRAAFASGHDLGGVKTQDRHVGKRSDRPTVKGGAQGMCGIRDQYGGALGSAIGDRP